MNQAENADLHKLHLFSILMHDGFVLTYRS